jgi:hypothetical protein
MELEQPAVDSMMRASSTATSQVNMPVAQILYELPNLYDPDQILYELAEEDAKKPCRSTRLRGACTVRGGHS